MVEALGLAAKGSGRVSPNPLVGAVVVRDGEVVGRGFHAHFGGAHAEVAALDEAGERARGAALYVSLEPCNHLGKTPPCTEAILRAGVGRVVCAVHDPNRGVAGGGMDRLRSNGVLVDVGLLEEPARRLNEAYLKHVTTGRPFVELKLAVSLDGRLATAGGGSRWISSEGSRAAVHAWRAAASAVLVGAGTLRTDDPLLTARAEDPAPASRQESGWSPRRIVVSTRLALPLDRRLWTDGAAETIVATSGAGSEEAASRLASLGVSVWRLPSDTAGRVSLGALLERCGAEGMNRVLAEGGAGVAAALLRERLVDRLRLFVAPIVLGDDGLAWAGALGLGDPSEAPRLEQVEVSRFGDDVLISGTWPAAETAGG